MNVKKILCGAQILVPYGISGMAGYRLAALAPKATAQLHSWPVDGLLSCNTRLGCNTLCTRRNNKFTDFAQGW